MFIYINLNKFRGLKPIFYLTIPKTGYAYIFFSSQKVFTNTNLHFFVFHKFIGGSD